MFALLPKLLERSGTSPAGSITGLYTVLVDGDDMNEPVADAVRSILDGHVVLTRELAHRSHYPAIDVLQSVSRLEGEIAEPHVRDAAIELRSLLAAYRDKRDLIAIGAYERGSDRLTDRAIELHDQITAFLRQRPEEAVPAPDADELLLGVLAQGTYDDLLPVPAAGEPPPALPAGPVGPSAIPPLNIAV